MSAASPAPPAPPPKVLLETLFPGEVSALYRYVDLLIDVGIERGLLGPREAVRVWERHILNCAVIEPVFAPGTSVCDLGSGAGLPGIVLALARPDLRLTLLEPLLRRATFLEEVVAELELTQVTVMRARAEDAAKSMRVDVVTARAVAPLDRLARWAMPLLAPGGELVAIKGSGAAEDLAAAGPALARLGLRRSRLESYGAGIVDPLTQVVRIESRR
jgi:16S rRNA (guanine527-N7)-methyltransferase